MRSFLLVLLFSVISSYSFAEELKTMPPVQLAVSSDIPSVSAGSANNAVESQKLPISSDKVPAAPSDTHVAIDAVKEIAKKSIDTINNTVSQNYKASNTEAKQDVKMPIPQASTQDGQQANVNTKDGNTININVNPNIKVETNNNANIANDKGNVTKDNLDNIRPIQKPAESPTISNQASPVISSSQIPVVSSSASSIVPCDCPCTKKSKKIVSPIKKVTKKVKKAKPKFKGIECVKSLSSTSSCKRANQKKDSVPMTDKRRDSVPMTDKRRDNREVKPVEEVAKCPAVAKPESNLKKTASNNGNTSIYIIDREYYDGIDSKPTVIKKNVDANSIGQKIHVLPTKTDGAKVNANAPNFSTDRRFSDAGSDTVYVINDDINYESEMHVKNEGLDYHVE